MCGAQATSCVSASAAIFSDCAKPFQITSTDATSIAPASRYGPEAAERVEVLAGAERDRRPAPRVRERGGVVRVDLEPGEVERLERARDADDPLRRQVEVEVDDRLRLALRALAERVEQPRQRVEQLRGRVPVDPAVAPEAGHQDARLVAGDDDVRLEGASTRARRPRGRARRPRRTSRASACRSPPTPAPASSRSATSRAGSSRASARRRALRPRRRAPSPSGRAARSRSRRSPSARSSRGSGASAGRDPSGSPRTRADRGRRRAARDRRRRLPSPVGDP